MQFRVLGPLEVRIDGGLVEFGGPKPRRLVVALLSHANNAVSVARLLDWLWPDHPPPPSAVATLQAHVSRLRRVLEPDRARWGAPQLLLTRSSGYLLSVGVEQLDVLHFEHEVAYGRDLLLRGDFTAATTTLSGALALWRGPALMELDGVPALRACVVRWEAMRHFATIMRIEADLELGDHLAAIPELEYLAATHPHSTNASTACSWWRCTAAIGAPTHWPPMNGSAQTCAVSSTPNPPRRCAGCSTPCSRRTPRLNLTALGDGCDRVEDGLRASVMPCS